MLLVGPVRSHCWPKTISWAAAGRASAAPPRSPAVTRRAKHRRIAALLSGCRRISPSVRERPDAEVVPDVPPEPVEALRLDDEEPDDQGPEHHQPEVRGRVEHGLRREDQPAERL